VRIIDREDFIHSDNELGSIMNATSQAVSDSAGFTLEESSAGPVFIPKKTNIADEPLTNTETDYELVQKAANGNLAAFENIYQRYHRRAYSICLRMTQSTAEAEDLTQEVFIQLFRKMGSFRGESAFSTWLHRLTVNQVLMHFRKRGVQVEKTTDDGDVPEQAVPGTENSTRMPVLDRIAIDNAIKQLPPGYRTVFMLHDVEGFEHEEIARMLGLSIGTSKSQLHKARLKLRGLIMQQKQ
jgi:RNA polymerase sigma-70 factor (ECF subfamily)